MSNFHPLEVVDSGSETQLRVGENLNKIISIRKVDPNFSNGTVRICSDIRPCAIFPECAESDVKQYPLADPLNARRLGTWSRDMSRRYQAKLAEHPVQLCRSLTNKHEKLPKC